MTAQPLGWGVREMLAGRSFFLTLYLAHVSSAGTSMVRRKCCYYRNTKWLSLSQFMAHIRRSVDEM